MDSAPFYLGDGVYVEWDPEAGPALILTTTDGPREHRIVLEPDVYGSLVRYVNRLQQPQRITAQPLDDEGFA